MKDQWSHDNPSLCDMLHSLVDCVCGRNLALISMAKSLDELAKDVHLIRLKYSGPLTSEVTGIDVTGVQTGEKDDKS